MTTAAVGLADCTGVVSRGINGTGGTRLLAAVAAAKPAALSADNAPVAATTPETPPTVHDLTRRSALSRSAGRYRAISAVPAATATATAATALVVTRLRGGGRNRGRRRRRTRGGIGVRRAHNSRCGGMPRVDRNDDFTQRWRLRGRRIEAVGTKRHRWEPGCDDVLRPRPERGEGTDMAPGCKTCDHTREGNHDRGREGMSASMWVQGGVSSR